MNILILGSGGREHAFAWKIKQSELCDDLYVAPGNSGTAMIAENVAIGVNDFEQIKQLVLDKKIEMVVVGPEDPLVNGIHDYFLNDDQLRDIAVIGPQQEAAKLEGSKDYAKEFMKRHHVPTAAYSTFNADQLEEGKAFLKTLQPPYVLKADGLAAGKGVLIINDINEAETQLENMLVGAKFGKASSKVVIEEFLDGIELSCFVLTDGSSYKILPYAKDYKRIGEGDTGLNTGGMGAVSPVPFADEDFLNKVEEKVVKPTIDGIHKDGLNFKGFVFIGLIKVGDEPKVIEYNVRMGDPETEVVLPRLKSDLLSHLLAVSNNTLEKETIKIHENAATTVVLVSGGYPEAYEKGKTIEGTSSIEDSEIFYAGAQNNGDQIITSGGRVMAITSMAPTHEEALKLSYKSISKISFDKMNYRKDIGFDL
ncbi:MAG: phosphoribosylamine--glycine ligase [bacterium]